MKKLEEKSKVCNSLLNAFKNAQVLNTIFFNTDNCKQQSWSTVTFIMYSSAT